jgi:glycosyltransferase involved in cell wall biosynthesis
MNEQYKGRILFVAAHRPNRSPSQRFRFEQYITYLRDQGFRCDYSWIISEKDDSFLYKPGYRFRKFLFLVKSVFHRLGDLRKASSYDVIFLQREALVFRSVYFEKAFSRKSRLIFDFDDAIWMLDISDANKSLSFLKNPEKTKKIIALSHSIVAGNLFLANYAKGISANVHLFPTTIDTGYHLPGPDRTGETVCIGWTGSTTTLKHFRTALPALSEISKKYGSRIVFKIICDTPITSTNLPIETIFWSPEREVEDLHQFDIGIMPLPDDEWSKGKCGLKGLQYMAVSIPTVMSPVGVNTEIITDGVNGFLAGSQEEWVEKLSLLIDNAELRKNLGSAGRKTVETRYSVEANKSAFKEIILRTMEMKKGR